MHDLEKFVAGFHRFKQQYFCDEADYYEGLKYGQSPKALVISCCDSRVDPAIVTDSKPGDLFVVRNVANFVPPYEKDGALHGVSSALEYAVKHLKVSHIIVMGHSCCGGITTLMDTDPDQDNSEFIGRWVNIAKPVKDRIKKELAHKPREIQIRACEMGGILMSLENLLSFPWVREQVEAGNLLLHGWYFDLQSGDLLSYDAEAGAFIYMDKNTVL